ncbi:sigma-54-dependent Fis family transcriptional regulator [Pseudoalteromonas luteoviolacea]|uniref:sigma-54-dependent transcriptional regulator n=1 Tax=Pseudoalteromonas luteoviolacea TaxID=43657 RepID=UPI001B37ADD8|nr:sigma-54 dependent transcriptional regulator [Pseudoalteromonas luteoviolacea]MBQ4814403.1 sigma-54-dependent Fis family transcriptional regulator [Pseudoalteromonas luteoviolacea]
MEKMMGLHILLVDDEPHILRSLSRALRSDQYTIHTAESGQNALDVLANEPIDVVVTDKNMPGMTGNELLAIIAEDYPDTIRIMLTAFTEQAALIDAINQGKVWGYLQKPWENDNLRITIEQALQTKMLIAERNMLRASLKRYKREHRSQFQRFIGSSLAMQVVYKAIDKAAPSRANVFITGPSGTGKELAAEAIHNLSPRNEQALICINCAAIPSELMESEIFGHVKGAFSGATNNRDGAATLADGGTLFLDEIGEMDMALQAKILRFIQTGTFQRVGSGKTERVDVRFVCATNRNPLDAIEQQLLREDLFYRLNVIAIDMPALAERDQDPLQIALYYLNKYSELENKLFVGFSKRAEQLILNYAWPGNVRQLENLIHSAVVMSDGPMVSEETLMQQLHLKPDEALFTPKDKPQSAPIMPRPSITSSDTTQQNGTLNIVPLSEVERFAIEQALQVCEDNVVKAAGLLEVSPSTLYRKIQKWEPS